MSKRFRTLFINALGILAVLGLLEAVLWIGVGASDPSHAEVPRLRTCGDCPYVYAPNPARSDVSRQGLRDREFEIPRPEGVRRVLVLGDSVPAGFGVASADTFPKQLERALAPVEVVNASADGWTAYNELQFYLARGRDFQPDLVLLALCLNDVVDPALHWLRLVGPGAALPPESLPNPRRHEEQIASRLRLRRLAASPSQLLRRLGPFLDDVRHWSRFRRESWRGHDGRRVPVFLTYEDTLSIEVWMDADSPEWRWLRGILERLDAAVHADGAAFALLVLPLAYQLDPSYPFLPQRLVQAWCEERGVVCIDALPALRRWRPEQVFLLDASDFHDIWHLTPDGHGVVARVLERRLRKAGLVRASGRR